ncbi:MAG: hypothetical protein RPS47_18635 [Colwellia sp.]|jgi:hypothetical protein
MDKDLTNNMFQQVRTSHRLIAAYYQRLMPLLGQVTHELDLKFYRWDSLQVPALTPGSENPFDDWSLALVPSYSPYFLFRSNRLKSRKTNTAVIGEFLLCIAVINDSGVYHSNILARDYDEGEIDMLEVSPPVEKSNSILRVALFTPCSNQDLQWETNIWDDTSWPEFSDTPISTRPDLEKYGYTNGFETPISSLMEDDGVESLVEKITLFKDDLLRTAAEYIEPSIPVESADNLQKKDLT